jgi:hypothetical protein
MRGVFAHQGGWDEILFVLLPIGLFAGLLALANKRAGREQAAREEEDTAAGRGDADGDGAAGGGQSDE